MLAPLFLLVGARHPPTVPLSPPCPEGQRLGAALGRWRRAALSLACPKKLHPDEGGLSAPDAVTQAFTVIASVRLLDGAQPLGLLGTCWLVAGLVAVPPVPCIPQPRGSSFGTRIKVTLAWGHLHEVLLLLGWPCS